MSCVYRHCVIFLPYNNTKVTWDISLSQYIYTQAHILITSKMLKVQWRDVMQLLYVACAKCTPFSGDFVINPNNTN